MNGNQPERPNFVSSDRHNDRPRIAITMGDPAGVGPELCAQLLSQPAVNQACLPIVFGDAHVLERAAQAIHCEVNFETVEESSSERLLQMDGPAVLHLDGLDKAALRPGEISANTGQLSFRFIEAAIEAALAGKVDGVATGPINKSAWRLAGIEFPGHTELFAERFKTDRFCMMMYAPAFSCSLVTTHVGYQEVPGMLAVDRILEVIELTYEALEKIEGRNPKLAILGLNPHAGEEGLFGDGEEQRLIGPAAAAARQRGIQVDGPLPPDTAFLPDRRESTDGFVCMYHDQGLIPFKALNFDSGVNITLGLPMVRTSVDHGTALDIAWQGLADVSSFIAAVQLAAKLARR